MDHLEQNNLTYFAHLKQAWHFALRSGFAGLILFAHGIFPNKFVWQGGFMIRKLDQDLSSHQMETQIEYLSK